MAKSKKALHEALRKKYMEAVKAFLEQNGEEVLTQADSSAITGIMKASEKAEKAAKAAETKAKKIAKDKAQREAKAKAKAEHEAKGQ